MAIILEPIIRFLMKTLKFPRRLAAAVTLLLAVGSIGTMIFMIINKLIRELKELSKALPDTLTQIYDNAYFFAQKGTRVYLELPEEVTKHIQNIGKDLSRTLLTILNSFITGVVNTAGSIPQILVFIIITLLSTYFIASDRDQIFGYIQRQIPLLWTKKIRDIKKDLFYAFFAYVRAQLILMTITFVELFIGFSLIGTNYTLTLALIISILDAFPFVGTGGVVIPWAIYNLFTGNIRMGLYLIILYLVVMLIRQMLEPKILSYQIGVHPLLTLMSMYLGLQWVGVLGLIVGPIFMLILKNILEEVFKGGIKETYYKAKEKYL